MADIKDIAQYIFEKQKKLSTMKLQKLVYYSQCWHLVWDSEALFNAPIEAWTLGPVCPALWVLHSSLRWVKPFLDADSSRLSHNERETVDAVLKRYGSLHGYELSELAHSEAPWLDARGDLLPFENSQRVISLDSMKEFYSRMAKA